MQSIRAAGRPTAFPSPDRIARQTRRASVAPFAQCLALPALALICLWLALLLLTHIAWLAASPSLITGGWRAWDRAGRWWLPGVDPLHPMVAPLPQTGALVALAMLFCTATGVHLCAVWQARHIHSAPRSLLWWILGLTAGMGVIALLLPVQFSDDVYSYISYGHMGIWYHANALIAMPAQFPHDPVLPYVYWRYTPSVYGPSWLALADLLMLLAQWLGGSLITAVALFKLVGLGAHLANTVLIWGILSQIAPQRRVLGTVLYAWCPLPLLEFASSGHNDAQMLTLLLLGIWCWARGLRSGAIIAWAAALLAKFVLILLVPVWLWWLMAQVPVDANGRLRTLRQRLQTGMWHGGVFMAVILAFCTPFWAGPQTVKTLLHAPTATQVVNSPLDLLVRWVPWPLSALVHTHPELIRATVQPFITDLMLLAFLALCGWAIVRYAARDVLTAATWVLVGYVVLASGWFWPWYFTWPLVFVALRRFDRLSISVLLFAGGVLLIYPLLPDRASLLFGLRALIAFVPGAGYLLAAAIRHLALQHHARHMQSNAHLAAGSVMSMPAE